MSEKISKIYRGSKHRKSSGSSILSKIKGNTSRNLASNTKSDHKSEISVDNSSFFVTNTEEGIGFGDTIAPPFQFPLQITNSFIIRDFWVKSGLFEVRYSYK